MWKDQRKYFWKLCTHLYPIIGRSFSVCQHWFLHQWYWRNVGCIVCEWEDEVQWECRMTMKRKVVSLQKQGHLIEATWGKIYLTPQESNSWPPSIPKAPQIYANPDLLLTRQPTPGARERESMGDLKQFTICPNTIQLTSAKHYAPVLSTKPSQKTIESWQKQ